MMLVEKERTWSAVRQKINQQLFFIIDSSSGMLGKNFYCFLLPVSRTDSTEYLFYLIYKTQTMAQ